MPDFTAFFISPPKTKKPHDAVPISMDGSIVGRNCPERHGTGPHARVVDYFAALSLPTSSALNSPTVVTSPLVIFHRRNGPVMSPLVETHGADDDSVDAVGLVPEDVP
jgi:hypothetical protein